MVDTLLMGRTERTNPYYVGEVAIRGSAIMYVCSCCLEKPMANNESGGNDDRNKDRVSALSFVLLEGKAVSGCSTLKYI